MLKVDVAIEPQGYSRRREGGVGVVLVGERTVVRRGNMSWGNGDARLRSTKSQFDEASPFSHLRHINIWKDLEQD
jgi:hypothetical protein